MGISSARTKPSGPKSRKKKVKGGAHLPFRKVKRGNWRVGTWDLGEEKPGSLVREGGRGSVEEEMEEGK